MRPEHFQVEMGRLKKRWSATYTDELQKLIAREVHFMPDDAFTRVVDELLGSSRQAPLVPEFREYAQRERGQMRERSRDVPAWDRVGWGCGTCFDVGVFLAVQRKTGAAYAFRCNCSHGAADGRRAVPQFKPGHEAEFAKVDPLTFKKAVNA